MNSTKTQLKFQPQMQFVAVSGEKTQLKKGENACLTGFDKRIFINHDAVCNDECEFNLKSRIVRGETVSASSVFKINNNKDYNLSGEITQPLIDKIAGSLTMKNQENKGSAIKVEFGLNDLIQQDDKGQYRGGWANNEPRDYYGNGQSIFSNPYFFNPKLIGGSVAYKNQNMGGNALYGVYKDDALKVGPNNSNGILSSGGSNFMHLGLDYKIESGNMPVKLNLSCQTIDQNTENQTILNRLLNKHSISKAGRAVVVDHFLKDDKLTTYTGVMSAKVQKGLQINGALTCASTKNTNGSAVDKGQLLKWSLGMLSKSKGLGCVSAMGLNIGTPVYNNKKIATADKDDMPLTCEASALITLCGFNIPIFVDYLNKKESVDVNNQHQTNSAIICGIRPNKIFGIVGDFNDTILPCPEGCPEGEE